MFSLSLRVMASFKCQLDRPWNHLGRKGKGKGKERGRKEGKGRGKEGEGEEKGKLPFLNCLDQVGLQACLWG